MKEIVITNQEQMNPFVDERRANNGGGYDQPRYEFEYDGKHGRYTDLSCGDFGSHYEVEYDDKYALWGSKVGYVESKFNSETDKEFLEAFRQCFGDIIPCEDTIEDDEY